MILTTRVGVLTGACALVITGVSFADSPTDQEARIAELEAKVAELSGDNWMTEQRADEIRGLVQDVLADADTRASLLNSGLQAGYDDGFTLGSADGVFSMTINGHLQTRYVYNYQDDAPPGEDTNRSGFENTRTRLIFSGGVGDGWTYYVNGGFYRSDDGSFDLQDAYIRYSFDNGWMMGMGQYKSPFSREFLVDSMNQLAVERSLLDYWFNAGRTQGIRLGYAADTFRFTSNFNDGADGQNNGWEEFDVEFAMGARFEFLFSGNWEQFDDFTSPMGSEQGFMVGVGVRTETQEYGTPIPADEADTFGVTADASLEFDGWNVFTAFHYLDQDTDSDLTGWVIQGAYYFSDTFEGFARFEYMDFDDSGDDLNILTVGVNMYYSANVTMTADVGYGFEAIRTPNTGAGQITGWRDDVAGNDGQFVFRTQLSLTF
jgi:hypothetical protein